MRKCRFSVFIISFRRLKVPLSSQSLAGFPSMNESWIEKIQIQSRLGGKNRIDDETLFRIFRVKGKNEDELVNGVSSPCCRVSGATWAQYTISHAHLLLKLPPRLMWNQKVRFPLITRLYFIEGEKKMKKNFLLNSSEGQNDSIAIMVFLKSLALSMP